MTIDEIKIKLNKTISILNDSKILERDSYKIITTDSSEKFTIIDNNDFLKNITLSLWKLSIIELHKLFGGKNDNFKISKLLTDILETQEKSEWCDLITKIELENLQKKMESLETIKNIENLKYIRDKYYAHSDENPKKSIYEIKYFHESSNYLIQLADNILEQLMVKLIDKNYKISKYNGENAINFINQQSEYIKLSGLYKLNNNI